MVNKNRQLQQKAQQNKKGVLARPRQQIEQESSSDDEDDDSESSEEEQEEEVKVQEKVQVASLPLLKGSDNMSLAALLQLRTEFNKGFFEDELNEIC